MPRCSRLLRNCAGHLLRRGALACALAWLPLAVKAQGGWTQEKGNGFFQLSYLTFASDRYFNLDGDALRTQTFRQQAWLFYGEYGLTPRLTTIVHAPLWLTNRFETTEAVSGIGDLRWEWKYALLTKKIRVAASVAPEFPTARANNFAQSRQNTFEQINLPTGDGEFNVWTTLAASTAAENLPCYASVFVAHNYRTAYRGVSFRDQLRTGAEVGYRVGGRLWIQGRLLTQSSLGRPDVAVEFIRGDGTEFTSFGLGSSYRVVGPWHVSAQYRDYTDLIIGRKNLYSAGIWTFGVHYEHQRSAR